MSNYSVTVKNMVERFTRKENLSTRERIDKGRELLFPPSYPIWEEGYRGVFETNFIRRFYFNEVGFEAGERFIFELENWLTLNMPYYIKMWESERFKYDPLTNYDLLITSDRNDEMNQKEARKENYEGTVDQDSTRNMDEEDKRNQKLDDTRNTQSTDNTITDSSTNRDSTTNDTNSENESSTQSVDSNGRSFERDTKSTQPDKRLNLSTNPDGTGAIEYADSIDEKLNTNTDEQSTESSGNRTGERESKTGETGTSSGTEETTRNTDETGNANSEESGTRNQKEIGTQNARSRSDIINDLDRNVTNVENFVERRFGSAGVKTYPELVEEYRASLLRLEIMIFNDMRKHLFMKLF